MKRQGTVIKFGQSIFGVSVEGKQNTWIVIILVVDIITIWSYTYDLIKWVGDVHPLVL